MVEYLFTASGQLLAPSAVAAGADGTPVILQSGLVGGVYYTGRPDLTVGALFNGAFFRKTVNYSDGSSAIEPPETVLAGQIAARYFF
jgi:hypothetical protein